MKKKLLLLAVLALSLPLAAFADNTLTFTADGGSLTATSDGFTLTGEQLTSISGLGSGTVTGTDLGSVTFTTNELANLPGHNYDGNVVTGSPISPGGTFTITGNGNDPAANGTLFTGTFDQAIWTLVSPGAYTLTATVDGTTGTGNSATGQFSLSVDTISPAPYYNGFNAGPPSSTTTLAVPEPSELSMLGTGILGLMGAFWRKLKVQPRN